MVKAWYMKDPVENQFGPNELEPPQPVSTEKLLAETGISCRHVDVDSERQDEILRNVQQAQACSYRDTIEVSEAKLGEEFPKKLAIFFDEHLHTDDEVRFILDGRGYFDVRDRNDRWIRIAVEKGDFVVLPAGIYHRFTVDESKYLKAMRLFAGVPVWTPHNRSKETDEFQQRQDYVHKRVVS